MRKLLSLVVFALLLMNSALAASPDVNGDAVVNSKDLDGIVPYVGKTTTDPSVDPAADVNEDTNVNLFDLVEVTKHLE